MSIEITRMLLILFAWCTGNFILIVALLCIIHKRIVYERRAIRSMMEGTTGAAYSRLAVNIDALKEHMDNNVNQIIIPPISRKTSSRGKYKRMTTGEKEHIKKLLDLGVKPPAIAKTLKLKPMRVYQFINYHIKGKRRKDNE